MLLELSGIMLVIGRYFRMRAEIGGLFYGRYINPAKRPFYSLYAYI